MDGIEAKLKKEKYERLYMDIAERISKMSYARRLQVGSILVKDDNIISFGWNGMPTGWDNDCENQTYDEDGFHITLKTKPEVIHAESNLLSKLTKSTNSGLDADLFVTHSPCMECAKLIHQSGIRRVYFGENYRDDSGIKFLEKSGVEVVKLG